MPKRSEIGNRLQIACDAIGCRSPSHRTVWADVEIEIGYTEKTSGLHYLKGQLMNGHRRPMRRRIKNKQKDMLI